MILAPTRSLLAAALCALIAPVQPAARLPPGDGAQATVAVNAFQDPRLKQIAIPADYKGNEGWVIVSTMVDSRGRPYEPGVDSSSGDPHLEDLAVSLVRQATFTAATLDGRPIEAVSRVKCWFRNPALKPGPRPEFVGRYERFQKALAARDEIQALAALRALDVTTLYEDAFYGMAAYQYAARWGSPRQQGAGLQRALAGGEYLSAQDRQTALLASFELQVQRHDYWYALNLWEQLQKAGIDTQTAARIEPVVAQIRASHDPYEINGVIGANGSWVVGLFRRSFRISAAGGALTEMKLRCSRGYVSFPFNPELQYTVEEKYGDCSLTLEGVPGTQLTLTQS